MLIDLSEPPHQLTVSDEMDLTDPTLLGEQCRIAGNNAHRQRNHRAALDLYNRAIDYCPQNLTYRWNRTAALFELGNFEECIEECEYIAKESEGIDKAMKEFEFLFRFVSFCFLKNCVFL